MEPANPIATSVEAARRGRNVNIIGFASFVGVKSDDIDECLEGKFLRGTLLTGRLPLPTPSVYQDFGTMRSSFQSFCMRFHAFACSGVRIVVIWPLYLASIAFSES